jgi:hypothetical protein
MVNNFRQKKCYFCPAPLGFLEVVLLLVILAGLSLVSRRNLGGLSKIVIKKSEVVPNLFQGYSKLIPNLFQKILFIFVMD